MPEKFNFEEFVDEQTWSAMASILRGTPLRDVIANTARRAGFEAYYRGQRDVHKRKK